MLLSSDMKNQLAIVYTQNREFILHSILVFYFEQPFPARCKLMFFATSNIISGQWNKTRFWYSQITLAGREETGEGNTRNRGEGDKEGGRRKGGGRGADRSDRVAYGVVAGSRKEQQIQWLYRPSPV